MALTGQNRTHTPHPSQAIGSMVKADSPERPPCRRTASNRQWARHPPQPMQSAGRITASRPLVNACRSRTSGASTRWRSAASTSQSANTGRDASAAKDATTLVLPVPPLPLMTTSSFIDCAPSRPPAPESP
jgi:hypothetical protein